jgi:cysteine desulfurase
MQTIYLDNAATTKPLPCVLAAMTETMEKNYGNASSLHKMGIVAENSIKESRAFLAQTIGAQAEEIIFTSGGTESNNLAILGAVKAYKRRGNKVIVSSIEHPSVAQVALSLAQEGVEVVTLPVDSQGYVDLEALKAALDKETLLVSIMHVNNELGTIQPIEKIGKLIKAISPQTLFHVDAVQSYTKCPLHVKKASIDLLSVSGHKFYGPKGVGFLYKNKSVRLMPLFYGGGHQAGLRSGTENTPAVVGMATAAKYVFENKNKFTQTYLACKQALAEGILKEIPHTALNGPDLLEGAPHILNVAFESVRAEVLLHALEQSGIYVSSGSACASNKISKQSPLAALGKTGENLDNAIRFSFSHENTTEEMAFVVTALNQHIAQLRRYTLGGKK